MSKLSLDVTRGQCLPLSKAALPAEGDGAGSCHYCRLPLFGRGEVHVEGMQRLDVCPLCHCCRHIDHAGMIDAGTLVWLPELTQEQLNVTSMVIFTSLIMPKDETVDTVFVERMKVLYKTFELRAQPIVTLFGGKNSLFDASHPLFFAQEINRLSPEVRKQLATKIDGIRLLPNPQVFMPFVKAILPNLLKKYPSKTWKTIEAKLEQKMREAMAPQ